MITASIILYEEKSRNRTIFPGQSPAKPGGKDKEI